jgi:hypothetical protein
VELVKALDSLKLDGGGKRCGGNWKKAEDSSHKYEGLAVSGRYFAGCNHQMIHFVVNMMGTGEKYAYFYLVFLKYFAARNVEVIYGDLMCKWYPWLKRVVPLLAKKLAEDPSFLKGLPGLAELLTEEQLERVIPIVAGLHAKLHGWDCQVGLFPLHVRPLHAGDQCYS